MAGWLKTPTALGAFSTVVLLGAAVVFAGAAYLGFVNLAYHLHRPLALAANVVLPSGLTLAALAATRLRGDLRLSLAFCLVAAVAALYIAEWFVEGQVDAKATQRPGYDSRSKIEVIRDLRRRGIDAYPVMRAKSLLVEDGGGRLRPVLGDELPALPLASLPQKTVVSCNETGKWQIYRSDAHGFHNPDDQWTQGPPAVMLVGDSFVHGSCVAPNADIAARLRPRFGTVLNLGVSGFGPLSMLAALKEYGEPTRPKIVVWAFFEGNDLDEDLPLERRSALLRRYMEDEAFSQGLFSRRDEWAARLKSHLDERLEEAMARFDDPHEKLVNFLQLFFLREKFGLDTLSLGIVPPDLDEQVVYFGAVLARSKKLVESWGGRMVFAYLPSSERYFAASHNGGIRQFVYDRARALAKRLDIPVVDLAETFAARPDPAPLFVYPGSHYSAEGYRAAADAIASELAAKGAGRR